MATRSPVRGAQRRLETTLHRVPVRAATFLTLLVLVAALPAAAQTCGGRWVAPGGSNAPNDCTNPAAPCGSIQYAVSIACDNETVYVGESGSSEYVEDVTITHPVVVRGTGSLILTHLRGTGATDAVRILSSNVTWSGIVTWHTYGHACLRIGDATHRGLRNIGIENATFRESSLGVIVDGTGTPAGPEQWIRFSGVVLRDNVADGTPYGGTGMLLTGGNGKLQVIGGRMHHNGGPGLLMLAATDGTPNGNVHVVGNEVYDNGQAPLAASAAGIEIHDASDVELEGNDFYDHTGPTGGVDGQAVALYHVTGGESSCNRFRNGDGGLALLGGTTGLAISSNAFSALAGTALSIDAASGAGVTVHENLFSGTAAAIDRAGSGTVDARHDWFGAASGPGGAFSGSGDPVRGDVDASGFVARADQPVLVRRPQNSGWGLPLAACYDSIQPAIDGSPAGSLLLVGDGWYFEHPVLTKPLDLEGVAGSAGNCPASIVYGGQSGGSHRPTFAISNTSSVHLSNLTLRNAAEGTPCGQATGDEAGILATNVSASSFTGLCFLNNGVSELRFTGNSNGNLVQHVSIDGLYVDQFGRDVCGHRSRDGVLIDGGPACEGGPGAIASGNQLVDVTTANVERGVAVRLASGTSISGSRLQAAPSAAWDGGTQAFGVFVQSAVGTTISNNTFGNAGLVEAIRMQGKDAAACYTEQVDAPGTVIGGNTITGATTGIRLMHAPADPGTASATITCNQLNGNGSAIVLDALGTPASTIRNNAISGNGTAGLVNNAGVPVDARANWWGDPSGPAGAGGSGDTLVGAANVSVVLAGSPTADGDGDGFSICAGDCDDVHATVYPGAPELCDGLDNDCNGIADEGLPSTTLYRDADGDGYGNASVSQTVCTGVAPAGWVADATDCNDLYPQVHPGAAEACDGLDDDCNGAVDDVALPAAPLALSGTRAGRAIALAWSGDGSASGYDLVRGTASSLAASHGNFALSTKACLASRTSASSLTDGDSVPVADAWWYLVRARNCGGSGSWSAGDPSSVGARDAGIAACP